MRKILRLICLGCLATSVSFPVLAQQTAVPVYRHHMWADGWFGWFLGPVMMILFLAAVIVVVVLLLRWLGALGHGGGHHHGAGNRALDILKERYARGDIDKEEFEERRRTLDS